MRVGIVGIGFMGMVHYLTHQRVTGSKVVAICEQDAARRAGDWRGIQGNFGPAGEQMDLTGVATYQDVDDLLADPQIDLVDICLPTAAHPEIAIRALEAGKHVFCEKPMALELTAARRMVAAAKRADRLLMIGQVLPTFPEYAFAVETARNRRYGELLGGHFKRVISEPTWMPKYYDPQVIGGPMLDLHIHDAHFIRYLLGMPTHVTSRGRMRGEVVEYFTSQYEFGDRDLTVTAKGGVLPQPARSFLHGYEIHFERATIAFEFAVIDGEPRVLMPCTVFPQRGSARAVKLGSGDPMDAFHTELKLVRAGVKSGQPAEFLSAELAQDAMRLCERQTQAVKSGKRVRVG